VDGILARVRGPSTAGEEVARRLLEAFDGALGGLEPTLHEAGERARRAAEKTRGTVERAVTKLAENVDAAWRMRDHAAVDDVTRLKQRLFPQDVPQERFFGMSSFAARHGERALVERVLAAADPGHGGTRELEL
jgi:hypothetical protein